MFLIFLYYAGVVIASTDPVASLYLGLGAVHLVAMLCYFEHKAGTGLALCNGCASLFYLLLALAHVLGK